MIRGTTPDFILTVDADLSGTNAYVTIRQALKAVTLTGDDLHISSDGTSSTIAFRLSQTQTLGLCEGAASVQVRFIDADGVARATEIAELTVGRVLLERVIEYDANDSSEGS